MRERHFREASNEYVDRLQHYATVEVREVERITGLQKGLHNVAMDPRGREFTSAEFAVWLSRIMASGARGMCFMIGGAEGLAEAVRCKANESLSLSRLTMAHRLARVVLLEQLYRAMTILRGEPYHR